MSMQFYHRNEQPDLLQVDDQVVVHLSAVRRYVILTVISVVGDRVYASAKGLGSFGFWWPDGRDAQGRVYYFKHRPVGTWSRPMIEAQI